MAQVYENDVTKVGGNLQKTVAYLLSLHKAEYEWNMLGIKVIGHVDALPIPDGTYEYGDTYMVGTTTPYDMWIYTRADDFHATDYWFNVGKFPQPGPQGPAGPGLDNIASIDMSAPVNNVTFDTTTGITVKANGVIAGTTGGEYDIVSEYEIPLVPGKYINMDADQSNSKVQVAVYDENLALDYYKINRSISKNVVPFWNGQNSSHTELTPNVAAYSAVQRDSNGNTSFNTVRIVALARPDSSDYTSYDRIYYTCTDGADLLFSKRPNDTGTIDAMYVQRLKDNPQMHVIYDNKVYYRIDPLTAPYGTLNYIHIDCTQDGSNGYKATGKCFSLTVSTRSFKVVDISFGAHTHQLTITDNVTNSKTYMTIVSNRTTMYTADDLITDMGERNFPCTLDSVQNDNIYAGVITATGGQFTVRYSNNQELNMQDAQVTITDYVV